MLSSKNVLVAPEYLGPTSIFKIGEPVPYGASVLRNEANAVRRDVCACCLTAKGMVSCAVVRDAAGDLHVVGVDCAIAHCTNLNEEALARLKGLESPTPRSKRTGRVDNRARLEKANQFPARKAISDACKTVGVSPWQLPTPTWQAIVADLQAAAGTLTRTNRKRGPTVPKPGPDASEDAVSDFLHAKHLRAAESRRLKSEMQAELTRLAIPRVLHALSSV